MVINDPYFLFNSVDLSDMIKSVSFGREKDELDDTTGGDGGDRTFQVGLRNASIEIKFRQNYTASGADSVDATIGADYDKAPGAASVPFQIRRSQSAVGSGNPKWTGNCHVTSYTGLDGEVGGLQDASATVRVTGAVARATA